MNSHKNARLTYARRVEMVTDIVERQLTPYAATAAQPTDDCARHSAGNCRVAAAGA
jgi:hypothetical protein